MLFVNWTCLSYLSSIILLFMKRKCEELHGGSTTRVVENVGFPTLAYKKHRPSAGKLLCTASPALFVRVHIAEKMRKLILQVCLLAASIAIAVAKYKSEDFSKEGIIRTTLGIM